MTTLPQTTTTVRLPRAVGNGAITTPPGGMAAVGVPVGSAGALTGSDIWRVLRSNMWMIFGMLICSGVLGYVANYFLVKNYPRYTAVGYIEVNPIAGTKGILDKDPNAAQDVGNVSLEQKTQAALLNNDSLLTKVLQNESSEIRKTQWFRKFNNSIALAKEDFKENYSVTSLAETKLVRIEFTNARPEECKTIVDEIVDQHIKDQQDIILRGTQERSVELTGFLNRLRAKISNNESTLGQFRATLSDQGGALGAGRLSIKEMELEQLVQMQTGLDLKLKATISEYEYVQQEMLKGNDPAAVNEMVMLDQQVAQLRGELLNIDYQLSTARDTLGDKNTRVQSLEKFYNKIKGQVADAESDSRLKARNIVLDKLRQGATAAKNDLDLMSARVEELRGSLGELTNQLAKYYTLMDEDKGLRERQKQTTEKLDDLMTAQNIQMGSKVNWRSHPGVPTNRTFPKLPLTMGVAITFGLLLSIGIAFLREVTDTSVRSERDIARVGHMTLLGMVADENDDPQAAGARLPLVIFDAPHSMTAEQLRQVRTRLQHTASLDATHSIMITSAAPGDGKTTIACNLAAGLALNGRRILLVDGNFRRPEIHRVFALGNDQGFSDVLNGAVAFEDMVHETQVPNLSVMTSGPKPINATEMFESQLLIDFISRALEEFDHVIFDSGPMMVVSESAAMAPRVDGVVTVVRARGSNRGQLTRMSDGLRATKAEHLGVVLNGVRAQGGGYYGRNIKTYYQYQNG